MYCGVRDPCYADLGRFKSCEFSVAFRGGAVVGLGGVDFLGEVAEIVGFVVGGYLSGPFPPSSMPVDAFVF